MYPPPTTKVFPGGFSNENISSEVIAYFSIDYNLVGLPPTLMTQYLNFNSDNVLFDSKSYKLP